MAPRSRKFIGLLALMAFILLYVGVALAIADRLPDNFIIKLIFYAVAGVGWGLPVLPLLSWMNRER